MKRLILHVGPHKTASTYIQEKLHQNKDLLAKHGVAYPDVHFFDHGHHQLLGALQGGMSPEALRKDLLGACGGHEVCLLSSESLYYLEDKELRCLRAAFPRCEIRVICYLRRPSLRLVSLWQEKIKHGGITALSCFLLEHCLRPFASREANIPSYIDLVHTALGPGSMALVDYETATRTQTVMSAFLKAAGLAIPLADTQDIVNPTMPLHEIELIRYLNLRALDDGLLNGMNVRVAYDVLREHVARPVEDFRAYMQPCSRALILGNTVCDVLIHEMLKGRHQSALHNALTPPAPKECQIFEDNWLQNARCALLADGIYRILKDRLAA